MGGSGRDFVEENRNAQPRFNFFFNKLKPFLQKFPLGYFAPESPEWNEEEYLGRCHDTVLTPLTEFEAQYKDYGDRLHSLLENLWGKDIRKKLHTMQGWLNSDMEVDSMDWWNTTLDLMSIGSDISELFQTGSAEIKKETHKIAAVAYINQKIFTFIQMRFEEPDDVETSHGFLRIINQYSEQNPSEQVWDDILSITSGSIAWQIYQQATKAVKAVKELSED
jgi:hypothetical protein